VTRLQDDIKMKTVMQAQALSRLEYQLTQFDQEHLSQVYLLNSCT